MANYAYLNETNEVIEVITGQDENNLGELPEGVSSWEEYYLTKRPDANSCKRTSINTIKNVHQHGLTPFRGNFAKIGGTYDEENDVFLDEKPYDSWIVDESNWSWKAPVDKPSDANDNFDTSLPFKKYEWNEDTLAWDLTLTGVYNEVTKDWEVQS